MPPAALGCFRNPSADRGVKSSAIIRTSSIRKPPAPHSDKGRPAESSASIPHRCSAAMTASASCRSGVISAAVFSGSSSTSRMASAIIFASVARFGASSTVSPASASRPRSGWVLPSCRQSAVRAAGLKAWRISARRTEDRAPSLTVCGHANTSLGTISRLSRSTESWCCGCPASSRICCQSSPAASSSPGNTTWPFGRSTTHPINSRVDAKVPVDPAMMIKSCGRWSRQISHRSRSSLFRRSAASITPPSSRIIGQRSIRMVSSAMISCQCTENRSGSNSRSCAGLASALLNASRSRPSESASIIVCGGVGAIPPSVKPRSSRANVSCRFSGSIAGGHSESISGMDSMSGLSSSTSPSGTIRGSRLASPF